MGVPNYPPANVTCWICGEPIREGQKLHTVKGRPEHVDCSAPAGPATRGAADALEEFVEKVGAMATMVDALVEASEKVIAGTGTPEERWNGLDAALAPFRKGGE